MRQSVAVHCSEMTVFTAVQDVCLTQLIYDIRGTLFNVTKRCQRFSECNTLGSKSCEIIGTDQYCETCQDAQSRCLQCMLCLHNDVNM